MFVVVVVIVLFFGPGQLSLEKTGEVVVFLIVSGRL